jgi:hypothetical protein
VAQRVATQRDAIVSLIRTGVPAPIVDNASVNRSQNAKSANLYPTVF